MGGVGGKEAAAPSSAPAYLADDAMAASGAQAPRYVDNKGLEVYGFNQGVHAVGAGPTGSSGPAGLDPDGTRTPPLPPPATSGDTIPTVFRWQHGGEDVYLTGTFNDWQEQACRMHPSGHDFTYIIDLPRGRHAYKFLVDGEWRFAPEQSKAADANGHIHNFIDLADFKTFEESEAARRARIQRSGSATGGMYGNEIPQLFDYSGSRRRSRRT